MPTFALYDEIRQEIDGDTILSQLRDAVRGGAKPPQWSVADGMVLFKGRIFLPSSSSLLQPVLELVHGTGHEGVHKTLHRL